MNIERMLVDLSNDHYVAIQYDASRRLWQIMTVGPIGNPTPTKHVLSGATLKEVVREMYLDLKPGTVHAG